METIKIGKHWTRTIIDVIYDQRSYTQNCDTCKYLNLLFKSILAIFIINTVIFICSFAIGSALSVLGSLLLNGMPLKLALSTILTGSTIASLGLTIIGIILVLFVFCTVLLFFEYRSEKIRQKHYENYLNKKELGFVTKLYNSFREKYCSKIEFVD